jgi:hypothetical protein
MMTRFFRHAGSSYRSNIGTPTQCSGWGLKHVKPQTAANPTIRIVAGDMLVIGALLTIGSIFADQLNLTGGGVGLGWKQLIGVVVGLVLLLLGGAWLIQPPTSRGIDRSLE